MKSAKTQHSALLWIVLAILLLCSIALSLFIGARTRVNGFEFPVIWDALTGVTSEQFVSDRIRRTAIAIVISIALACSGAAMQGMMRNPLADPGILGINVGASAAIVLGIFWGMSGSTSYIVVGFVGALTVTALLQILSLRSSNLALTSVLLGAAVQVGLGSLISLLMIIDLDTLDKFRFWQVGSLGRATWTQLASIAPIIAVCVLVLLVESKILNLLSMGDETAQGTGVNIAMHRTIMTVTVALAASGAVSLAGPVGFLGLIVPHAARLLVGFDYARILCACMLLAPSVILMADVIGRVIWPPTEIPVGVSMAVVGVPFFIVLIRSRLGKVHK